MKQVVRRGMSEITVTEVPAPPVAAWGVLVRPAVSLISSGTETASLHPSVMKEVAANPGHLARVLGIMKAQGPARTIEEVRAKFSELAALGYAGAGVVAAVGAAVRDLEPGMRVAYGGEGTGHAEYIVTGRNLVARLPDSVGFEQASFATLGSIAMNAVRIAELGLGDTVAVVGLGLVGQLVAQLARLQGTRVIGIDLDPERCRLARELGAHLVADASGDTKASILALTDGRGVDCAIICAASKSSVPCEQALAITRDRGHLVIVGAVEVRVPWAEAYMKEVRILMARAYGPGSYDPQYEQKGIDYPVSYVRWTENRNMGAFLDMLATKSVNVGALVSHRFKLEEADRAYTTIMDPGISSLAVTLQYQPQVDPAELPPARTIRVEQPSPPTGVLGVGIVGASGILRWAHLPSLRSVGGGEVVAVYSSNGVRARSYAERYGAKSCTTEFPALLAENAVDILFIASRNQYHAPQALAGLRAGKHVFVEKPMALTYDECAELVQEQERSGKVLWVGFNRRYAPDYIRMRRMLSKRSGPAVINCRVNSPGISGTFWMADPRIGGAVLGEACHFVDLFYWLLDSEPEVVTAFSLPNQDVEPIGMNNLVASVRFADGSIANLTYCTVGDPAGGGEEIEAFAPGIRVGTSDFKGIVTRGSRWPRSRRLLPAKGYVAQMQAFMAAVRGEHAAPVVGALDGARATIGCLAILESAANGGRPTSITLPPR